MGTYKCEQCKGTNVQTIGWIYLNTPEVYEFRDLNEFEDNWCDDCKENVNIYFDEVITTAKEFNEKYFKYLETNHYGLAINNIEVVKFLDKKFEEYIKTPGFYYSQIKLKFGLTKIYCILSISEIQYLENTIDEILKNK
jgi:hypothetical protein